MRAFAESLLSQNALDDLLWDIAAKVGDLFGYEDCVVYLVEQVGLVQSAAYGVKSPALRRIKNPLVLPLGHGIVGTVAVTGRSERIADTARDARYIPDEFLGRSELAVPITFCGKVIGVLDSESIQPDDYSAEDQATFELIATLAAPRVAAALAERDLRSALTSLERAESAHRDRELQLQRQRLESLGQLAGGIAHDFNNLLTTILGNVSLAQEVVRTGPSVPLLADAAMACERSRELARQLLAFSAGGAPVLRAGDFVELVREVVATEIGQSGIAVSWQVAKDLPVVAFDVGQLRECLRNVLANAREAMAGNGNLRLAIAAFGEGERELELSVHDSGPGVPSPLRARVFDPYFTTKEGAAGLGLSVAYWIARRHGGGLELDPAVMKGARFRLWLPRFAEVRRSEPAARVEPLRVLVLDDEPAVREVVVRMLQTQSHDAVGVGDGVACIREFAAARQQRRPFDVVLLDLTLRHGIAWEETFAALRQMDGDCVAIAISGYHDSPVMASHSEHGLRGSLAKPFTPRDLERALREALAAPRGRPAG